MFLGGQVWTYLIIHPVQTPNTLLLIGTCFTSHINKNIHDIHIRYGMKVLRNSHAIVAEDFGYTHEKETKKIGSHQASHVCRGHLREGDLRRGHRADRNNWPSVFQPPVAIPFPNAQGGCSPNKNWGSFRGYSKCR